MYLSEQRAERERSERWRQVALKCRREHREHWEVLQRLGNASAFNGYHWTPSDYSSIHCRAGGCGRVWRTKAAYVSQLPDAERKKR